ncbi:DUF2795 domain-containing protein [Streptomyces millisiae]|uniref:DUF2795 domain-containing protein n=1 Tax=Streptomyces millisiae TaxID=3075542 RepID=A0ABU2LJ56_9ACTN|nr:DUF2795 domain-containing protein [Streptomyces sp. DSM 44918]MDT0317618.1 DUF2795 domain-containing protein [Streptomyces sp. DSM 44918]
MAKTNPIEVQQALKGAAYPADKNALVDRAKQNHANSGLVHQLEELPSKQFNGPNDVEKAIFRS